jgi:serine protease Do
MPLSHRRAVQSARASVVTVWVRHLKPREEQSEGGADLMPADQARQRGNGSGIVLTTSGLVLTNHHVVEGAREILLRPPRSLVDIPAEIVGLDAGTDVALLRAKEGTWNPATLADSSQTEPGDVVLAMGSPFGLEQTVTMGIVSATGRAEIHGVSSVLQDFIQTDAAINPGNSGGPLLDGLGRVIGMNTARYAGESIGLAVPVNLALKVADDLLREGRVGRGHLGVTLTDVTPQVIAELELGSALKGAVVMSVEKDQPAAKAGMLPGDVITAVNGQEVTSTARLRMRMTTLRPGESVRLSCQRRQGKAHEVTVVLGAQPGVGPPPAEAQEWELFAGLRVVTLDDRLRNKLLLPKDFKGLLARSDFKLPGGVLKVAAGDLILRINGSGIYRGDAETDEQMHERMRPKKPLVLLRLRRKSGEEADVGFTLPTVPNKLPP